MRRSFDPSLVGKLKAVLARYLGVPQEPGSPSPSFSESDKFEILPAVFALMPREAAMRTDPYQEIKPLIRKHLVDLGVTTDDLLVDLIKVLCDNFERTRPTSDLGGRTRPRKASISDLRQQIGLYKRIRESQNHRCAACGANLNSTQETLDHVIPWRLGGDPAEGANWQILCEICNSGKSDLLTSFMLPEYFNWIYTEKTGQSVEYSIGMISRRTRYLALSASPKCSVPGCPATAATAQLYVVRQSEHGLSVFDHLEVLCEQHVLVTKLTRLQCGPN